VATNSATSAELTGTKILVGTLAHLPHHPNPAVTFLIYTATCACIAVWTLKILLIPIWAIAGIPICLLAFLAYVIFIFIMSVFRRPCKYLAQCFKCRQCWEFLAIIFCPVSKLGECFGLVVVIYYNLLGKLIVW
jgi:hypothetical protein